MTHLSEFLTDFKAGHLDAQLTKKLRTLGRPRPTSRRRASYRLK